MSQPVVISLEGVVKRFANARGEPFTVLDGVTLDVHAGETLVLMGGSGCGKSTLLNCLIGELPIDGGRIRYRLKGWDAPLNIAEAEEDALNALRKRFGVLFQSGALFSSMTVAENVALPLLEHSYVDKNVVDIMVTMKLQLVRMLEHRDKMPAQLSGGQKKRAGLARALAMDPEVLFYDEPSAGLDPVTSAAIDDLMSDLSKKLSVTSVVVTHEMDSAFRIADRMVMLDKGKVLRIGSRDEFEKLRNTPAKDLKDAGDRLIQQFLTGGAHGPLTDDSGMTEFEKLIGVRMRESAAG
jgi:phospholipid/cholesterol/gamma-HCH transport system ATP-binding protein